MAGSSTTLMPGNLLRASRAACGVMGFSVSMVMASECARRVGMRTAVQLVEEKGGWVGRWVGGWVMDVRKEGQTVRAYLTGRSGTPKILRASQVTFISSLVYMFSVKTSIWGMTLKGRG